MENALPRRLGARAKGSKKLFDPLQLVVKSSRGSGDLFFEENEMLLSAHSWGEYRERSRRYETRQWVRVDEHDAGLIRTVTAGYSGRPLRPAASRSRDRSTAVALSPVDSRQRNGLPWFAKSLRWRRAV